MTNKPIFPIYQELFKMYGPQGWWPLTGLKNTLLGHSTKSGSLSGYHPGDYTYPKTENQIFEICLGAIATQNTSWLQAEKAIENLKTLGALDPKRIYALSLKDLELAMKPAGYFRQKAKKIKKFTDFYLALEGRTPSREELLDVWGIGPETADSILLYAFKVPAFVVDSYTRRIAAHFGFVGENASYDEIKALFEDALRRDIVIYQEYHALLVEHAKRYYRKKPYKECPLYQTYTKFH